MPTSPARPCTYPGCGRLVTGKGGRCDEHRRQVERERSAFRRASGEFTIAFYNSQQWRRFRAGWLREFPLCGMRALGPSAEHSRCHELGLATPAAQVDHIEPVREGGNLFDRENLQSLCESCHSRKSMTRRNDLRLGIPCAHPGCEQRVPPGTDGDLCPVHRVRAK